MLIKNGYYLSKDKEGFFIYNEKIVIRLSSISFKNAIKEANNLCNL